MQRNESKEWYESTQQRLRAFEMILVSSAKIATAYVVQPSIGPWSTAERGASKSSCGDPAEDNCMRLSYSTL